MFCFGVLKIPYAKLRWLNKKLPQNVIGNSIVIIIVIIIIVIIK